MKPLTLFLMTRRGYSLLCDIEERFGHLFEEIVIARDPQLDDDCFAAIASLCQSRGMRWRERSARDGGVVTPYALAVGWRWMIDHQSTQLVVFHDSLLPRYRGFNPLVSCLINGEMQIGVTALLGGARYDAGDVLAQSASSIEYPIKIADAIELVRADYKATATEVLQRIEREEGLVGQPQHDAAATYSLWRDEDDYRIAWGRSATWIARFVDAVGSPYKGACSFVDGVLARIDAAVALPDVRIENRTPGKVIWMEGTSPVVVCGEGLLKITRLRADDTGASMLPLKKFRSRFT
ncbi:MAG TPA: formyltransferase family protein [Trinickia sp.]|uniref:formyltransferase family protein n=1 Tax=Trinickia sp. TaxID=2571163 RepID=UPI002B704BE8|nr:formyltransferase family protein [Trinickia sp.]HVW52316.1 formyltransferase family protein [Trinickia sp.]